MTGNAWVSLRLGEVCTKIGSGATPRGGKEVYLKDGPCALIRSQNVYNNRFSHDGLAFISQQQLQNLTMWRSLLMMFYSTSPEIRWLGHVR